MQKEKKIFWLLFLLSGIYTYGKDVVAPPYKAKIYQKQAQLFHRFSVALQPGENKIVLIRLSPYIDVNTIQVQTEGNDDVGAVNFRLHYLTEEEQSSLWKRVKDSLTIIQKQIALEQSMIKGYQNQLSLMDANKKISGSNTNLSLTELKNFLDFYQQKTVELEQKIREANIKLTELQKVEAKLNQQLNDIVSTSASSYGEIEILINAKSQGNRSIYLHYVTQRLSWIPRYNIQSEGPDKNIRVEYKAEVVNTTGIPYQNLELVFSTGRPYLSIEKPVLTPWWIDFQYHHTGIKAKRAGGYGGRYENIPAATTLMESDRSEMAMEESASVIENLLNVDFQYPKKADIPVYPSTRTFELTTHDLKAWYEYICVPKIDESVFLLGGITEWEQLNLIAGNANVYFQNTYIGKTYLDPNITEDTLKFSFGRDENLIVQRKKVKDFTDKNLLAGNKKVTQVYEIHLRNNHEKEVEIVVKDQVPVSQNQEIVVKLEDKGGASYDEKTGELKWNAKLKPKENKVLSFSFSVQYPRNKTVILR